MLDNRLSVMDWVNGPSLQLVLCMETDLYVQEPTYIWSFWHTFLKGQVRVWKAITNMPLHCSPPPSHPPLCLLHYIFNWQVLLPAVSFSCCHFQCISPSFSLSPTALNCETTGEHSTPLRSANYCREDFSRYFNSCFLLPSSGSKWRAPLSRTPGHILGKSVKSRKLLQWVVWLWHQQCLKSPSEQK